MVDERDHNEHLLLLTLRRHIPHQQEQRPGQRAADSDRLDRGHARHPVRLEPGGRGRATSPARQAAHAAPARGAAGVLAAGRAAGHHPGMYRVTHQVVP